MRLTQKLFAAGLIGLLSILLAGASAAGTAPLVNELGCGACHAGIGEAETIRRRAPDLTAAGDRFPAAYLFHYLRSPDRVRSGIGRSRMPDYGFSEVEALSLTLFLVSGGGGGAGSPGRPVPRGGGASRAPDPGGARALIESDYGCLGCHRLDGRGAGTALDLSGIAARRSADWLRSFLADPTSILANPNGRTGDAAMPSLFFRRTDRGLEPLRPGAAADLESIVAALVARSRDESARYEAEIGRAIAAHPEADAALGRRVALAQRCAACHEWEGLEPVEPAPDLTSARLRFRTEWLRAYLADPRPVRPLGHPVGTGGRMPRFELTPEQAEAITRVLAPPGGGESGEPARAPAPDRRLTPYQMRKAERLLRERLSCLGCHRLGSEGGRVGPDLSSLGRRLQPAYVRRIVRDPGSVVPGGPMPEVRMPEAERALVVDFLLQQEMPASAPEPFDWKSALPTADDGTVPPVYRRHCAVCHGEGGAGDGPNARFLQPAPAALSDSQRLRGRTDDTLYDAISAGARILGGSPRMPAWGHTLEPDGIRALVATIRKLCRCQGPAWSLDGPGVRREVE